MKRVLEAPLQGSQPRDLLLQKRRNLFFIKKNPPVCAKVGVLEIIMGVRTFIQSGHKFFLCQNLRIKLQNCTTLVPTITSRTGSLQPPPC